MFRLFLMSVTFSVGLWAPAAAQLTETNAVAWRNSDRARCSPHICGVDAENELDRAIAQGACTASSRNDTEHILRILRSIINAWVRLQMASEARQTSVLTHAGPGASRRTLAGRPRWLVEPLFRQHGPAHSRALPTPRAGNRSSRANVCPRERGEAPSGERSPPKLRGSDEAKRTRKKCRVGGMSEATPFARASITMRPRVVIVGSGFGGLWAAKPLVPAGRPCRCHRPPELPPVQPSLRAIY